ncbi:MAG: AMP-binding protein [Kineosporiaceae bacterium]|nr:AMP-binding protein [Kineosporiaceae bacterium]
MSAVRSDIEDLITYDALATGPGVSFVDSRGGVNLLDGATLDRQARALAANLLADGMRPGDRVLFAGSSDRRTLVALTGVLLAGGAPCLLPVVHGARWVQALGRASMVVRPWGVLDSSTPTSSEVLHLWEQVQGAGIRVLDVDRLITQPPSPPTVDGPADAAGVHHLQLTSGSTSRPKAVVLSHANVAANMRALIAASGLGIDEVRLVSWLPLYHDMGLLQVIVALSRRRPLTLMAPTAFLRDPLAWLVHLSRARATHTAAPPFAYRACVEAAVRRGVPDGLDLTSVQQFYVGAEPIPTGVLRAFERAFAPAGLQPDALTPAYGMAETVLATTVAQPTAIGAGRIVERAAADDGGYPGVTRAPVISCGKAVEGMTVEVVDPGDRVVDDGTVGRIMVGGSSVMNGYLQDGVLQPAAGRIDTGDLGFLVNGELHVVGRLKELVIVNGRNLVPSEVEECVEDLDGVDAGRSVAFGVLDPSGAERLIIVVEGTAVGEAAEQLASSIEQQVREQFGISPAQVLIREKGAIARTTSGKRQRGLMRARWLREHHETPRRG